MKKWIKTTIVSAILLVMVVLGGIFYNFVPYRTGFGECVILNGNSSMAFNANIKFYLNGDVLVYYDTAYGTTVKIWTTKDNVVFDKYK